MPTLYGFLFGVFSTLYICYDGWGYLIAALCFAVCALFESPELLVKED